MPHSFREAFFSAALNFVVVMVLVEAIFQGASHLAVKQRQLRQAAVADTRQKKKALLAGLRLLLRRKGNGGPPIRRSRNYSISTTRSSYTVAYPPKYSQNWRSTAQPWQNFAVEGVSCYHYSKIQDSRFI
jgi:hypothetical protein